MDDGVVTDICESSRQEVIVVVRNPVELTNGVAVLDMKRQTVTDTVWLEQSILGLDTGKEKDILLVDTNGICDYSLAEQSGIYYVEWGSSPYKNVGLVRGIRLVSENRFELFWTRTY